MNQLEINPIKDVMGMPFPFDSFLIVVFFFLLVFYFLFVKFLEKYYFKNQNNPKYFPCFAWIDYNLSKSEFYAEINHEIRKFLHWEWIKWALNMSLSELSKHDNKIIKLYTKTYNFEYSDLVENSLEHRIKLVEQLRQIMK